MARILIIDDEADVRELLTLRLSAEGFKVLTAKDSFEGIEVSHAEKPDLIILDLMLPAGGGLSILNNLRSRPDTSSIPVVVLTASQSPGYEKEVMKHGVSAYIRKPYEAKALMDAIRKVLGKPA